MVTLYTSTGEYIMRRNEDGHRYPIVVLDGKEYHLSVSEMILWTKGLWNICTHDLLREAFRKEEKILGEMNFDFILSRLVQRGLLLAGEANSDVEALHILIDNLTVKAADVSLLSQIKAFLVMILMMNVPVRHAKTVFKKYDLTSDEQSALTLTKNNDMTVADLIRNLKIDDTAALMLISNLYLRKLVRFSEYRKGAGQ